MNYNILDLLNNNIGISKRNNTNIFYQLMCIINSYSILQMHFAHSAATLQNTKYFPWKVLPYLLLYKPDHTPFTVTNTLTSLSHPHCCWKPKQLSRWWLSHCSSWLLWFSPLWLVRILSFIFMLVSFLKSKLIDPVCQIASIF